MAIPNDEKFQAFLSSVALLDPNKPERYAAATILPASVASDGEHLIEEPECRIWYPIDTGLKFEAVLLRIQKELAARQHKADSVHRSWYSSSWPSIPVVPPMGLTPLIALSPRSPVLT
jgi:hypothetical protein